MTTLFDSTTIVKTSTFGRGVLASQPDDTMPFTADDLMWAAQAFGDDATDYDTEPFALEPPDADELKRLATHLAEQEAFDPSKPDDQGIDEQAALESAAMDAIEFGLIPRDLADYLMATSLVGHPA